MADPRIICWFSAGAASAVAAQLTLREHPDALLVRCETGNEDEDNHRFEADVVRWLNRPVTVLRSDTYESVFDVWSRRRYMAGVSGAVCTTQMKVKPRLAFQRPDDVHVFGYTADSSDEARFKLFRKTYFELTVRAPLIDAGVTKAAALAMIERAGLKLPRTYAMGFPNANCIGTGCCKATSPDYWALFRHHFPERFARTAAKARELDVRLCRLNGERAFIDEIPADHPMSAPIVPACDFLCAIAEHEPQQIARPTKCYLAHPVTDYGGTRRQLRAIEVIESRGWVVENPDTPPHQEGYRHRGMGHFIDVVSACDALAFMRFPSGEIGAGVAKEIERALQCKLPVFDVSDGKLHPVGHSMPGPILTVEKTRAILKAEGLA